MWFFRIGERGMEPFGRRARPSAVIPIPTDRSGVILRENALRAGLSEADLDEAVTRDHLVCLGPGVFALAVGYLLWSRGC